MMACEKVLNGFVLGWNWKFGKSIYFWSKQKGLFKTWESARTWCQLMDKTSHLVKIETKEENDYLKKHFGGYDSWIGASDIDRNRVFRWLDGSQLAFSDWAQGEPSDYKQAEDCVQINDSKNNMWNDIRCSAKMYFICEKEI